MSSLLSQEDFTFCVSKFPLISIDICAIKNKKILLGKRNNNPAKDFWFTPGGRIRKNEEFNLAFERICQEEIRAPEGFSRRGVLLGAWDHFYETSAFSEQVSTHYVNLPHSFFLEETEELDLPEGDAFQHSQWKWWSLQEVVSSTEVHEYAKLYARITL